MAKISFQGTPKDLEHMKNTFQMMSQNGDDTVEWDAKDPQSVKDVISKICKELKIGKLLFGGNKGKDELVKIADKNDIEAIAELEHTLKSDAYDRLMLAMDRGDDILLGAIPQAG